MEDINKAVSALASLIVAHNERIRAYQSLADKSPSDEVKSFCARHIEQAKQFASNLSTWRSAYGGFAKIEAQSINFNAWHQVRLLFGFSVEKTIMNRCAQLDRETLKMYGTAIPFIPGATLKDMQMQAKEVEKALRRLQELGERATVVATLATK